MAGDRIWRGTADAAGVPHLGDQKPAFLAYVREKLAGQAFELIIRPAKDRKRTSQANRYYWGVVIAEVAELSEHGQHDRYILHDALAFKYLRLPDCPLTGSPRRQRTPELDSHEFAVYLDLVKQFVLETWGVVVPDPGQVDPPDQDWPTPAEVDREHGWGVAGAA